jgi:DNA-binding NtrC family response regulator
LLVEDHPCVRLAFTRLLGRVGVTVVSCESVEEAVPLLEQEPVDVALVDCRLPGQPGTALAAEAAVRWPDVRVILMSAEDDYRDVAAVSCPGTPFLRKPVAPERLIHAVFDAGRARPAIQG